MGVSGHLRRAARPAGEENAHRLVVLCPHTGVAVAGMSRRGEAPLIPHIRHSTTEAVGSERDPRSRLPRRPRLVGQAPGISADDVRARCHPPLHLSL